MAFLAARRRRMCRTCKQEFQCEAPHFAECPTCSTKGYRVFDHLTLIAGRRWGKSRMGSIAGAEEATVPNTVGWACAPTIPKLHRYVIPAFQKLIPEYWVDDWNGEFKDLRLKNGSLIHFQTLEDPDQGRGQGLDWCWVDEVCELSERHWEVLAPSLADRQGAAFFTTSPRSYDWVYEKLYRPAEDGTPGYFGLHATTSSNPLFQTTEGRRYLDRQREQLTSEMYRQEFEADFVVFTGAVYGTALDACVLRAGDEPKIKLLIPEWPQIASWRQILIGLDTGADHPFGAVKFVSTEGGLVCIGEYLERNRSFSEHARELHRLAGGSNVRWAINKNEKQGILELAQHGIYAQKSENDVVAGIERVKSWIHRGQLWFIESLCPRTVKELKSYRWAENKSNDGQLRRERVYKLNDELCDGTRYALMSWPQLPSGPPATEEKPRDISGFSPELQHTIQRLRRIDKQESEKPDLNDCVADFYL